MNQPHSPWAKPNAFPPSSKPAIAKKPPLLHNNPSSEGGRPLAQMVGAFTQPGP